jgi:TRAP-type C4-dicarboxylate transport system permease large subunit
VLKDTVVLSSPLPFIIACTMTYIWLLIREKRPVAVADLITEPIQNKYVFLLVVIMLPYWRAAIWILNPPSP